MSYYLDTYLGGMDSWQAYERFGMDYAIYVSPRYVYADRDLANWQVERTELGSDADGNERWVETIFPTAILPICRPFPMPRASACTRGLACG